MDAFCMGISNYGFLCMQIKSDSMKFARDLIQFENDFSTKSPRFGEVVKNGGSVPSNYSSVATLGSRQWEEGRQLVSRQIRTSERRNLPHNCLTALPKTILI